MEEQVDVEVSAPTMDHGFPSGGLRLRGHLAEPAEAVADTPGVVVCHGFPTRGREAPQSGLSFPELAERIAHEVGWVALSMNFRGCGRSEGQFSLTGWLDDVHAGVEHVQSLGVRDVWLCGFGTGGSLALCEAGRNPEVRGVAALATPADFDDWAKHPRRLVLHAREVGVITDQRFPPSVDRWAQELRLVRPLDGAARLSARPLLVIHGDSDDLTPLSDAEAIVEAHGSAELRVVGGAGHELRHDPRAVAVLLGWLARQRLVGSLDDEPGA
ncbi:MAG: alpha/beta hydrolase [Actinobacteria bacterium]|nr:alpha/beta hydrolase [Actinomycetota bacterium]